MTVYANDVVLDAPIDFLITNGQKAHLLNTYSDVYATITGANGSMGNFVPVITKADNDGAGGGRMASIAAATDVAISTVDPGTPENFTHYAIVDDTNSRVLFVGEGTTKSLSDGDTVSTPVFKVRLPDAITTP